MTATTVTFSWRLLVDDDRVAALTRIATDPTRLHYPPTRVGDRTIDVDWQERLARDAVAVDADAETLWLAATGLIDALDADDPLLLAAAFEAAACRLGDLRTSTDGHWPPPWRGRPGGDPDDPARADDVAEVVVWLLLRRAWAVSQVLYRSGSAPVFVDGAAQLLFAPDGLEPSAEIRVANPGGPPSPQRQVVTVGDWRAVLSGYLARVMARPRAPHFAQVCKELPVEQLSAFDVARAAFFLTNSALDDLVLVAGLTPGDGLRLLSGLVFGLR